MNSHAAHDDADAVAANEPRPIGVEVPLGACRLQHFSRLDAEPFEEQETGGKGGPSPDVVNVRVTVNVWAWPCVRFVYGPRYRVWVSPWRWASYPGWFRPWHPHPWGWHHARCAPFRAHCHIVTTQRVVYAHKVYAPHRRTAVVVHTRPVYRAGRPHGGGHYGPRRGRR